MTDAKKEIVVNTPITPMDLLNKATESGADLNAMSKLMDMHERWEKTEAQKAFTEAMMAFQYECPFIDKVRKSHNTKYANLADTLKQIKPLMKKHGFAHNWRTEQLGSHLTVICCVTHIQGHKEFSSMMAAPDDSGNKNMVQAIGSTNTYLQRYTLFSVLGLASVDQDDDGNSASGTITKEQAKDIESRLEAAGGDKIAFCRHMKVDSIPMIPASQYGKVDHVLRAKEKKNAGS